MIIILLIVIIVFLVLCAYYTNNGDKKIYNIKLDNIEIIKRGPEYQKLINKLMSDKKELFTKEEMKTMENKFQFYNTDNGIDNISDEILKTFKDYDNKKIDISPEENIYIAETINETPAYNAILKNIGQKYVSSCKDVEVLKNKSYLKNYYYDMDANRIQSNLKDYINDIKPDIIIHLASISN